MSDSILKVDEYGRKVWHNKDGQLHRLDGPAIEWNDGDKYWCQDGKHILHEQATVHLLKSPRKSHCGTRLHKSTVDLFLAPSYDYEEFLDQACQACWLLWRAEP